MHKADRYNKLYEEIQDQLATKVGGVPTPDANDTIWKMGVESDNSVDFIVEQLINDGLVAISLEDRIQAALDYAVRYGGIDGGHHKAWVIDHMCRMLAKDYRQLIKEACDGEDGPETYEWDVGIAP